MKAAAPRKRTVLNKDPEKYISVHCYMSENWRHLSAKELHAMHQKQGGHPVYELRPDRAVIVKGKMNDSVFYTMNKARIEALSDGLFSVAMTILIFNIKTPSLTNATGGHELLAALYKMLPVFRGYFMSFAILGMYWIAHHGLFHHFAKHAKPSLTHLNILFLCLIVLIPFSTYLIDEYPMNAVAVMAYGLNIIVIGMVQYWMFRITINDPQSLQEGDNWITE